MRVSISVRAALIIDSSFILFIIRLLSFVLGHGRALYSDYRRTGRNLQEVKDEVVKIEWINITRGIAIVLLIMLWGHYFIDCKKIHKTLSIISY